MSEFIEQGTPTGPGSTGAIVSRAREPEMTRIPAEPTNGLGLFGGAPEPVPQPMGAGFRFSPAQLLRFKWSILFVFLLVSGSASAFIWTMIVPLYRASAEIRVRPIIPRIVFRTEENGMIPLYASYMNTQVSVIRSPTVLQKVLDDPAVQKTKWYKGESASLLPQPERSPLERLRESLTVRPRDKTEVIDVAFVSEDGADGAVIANTVLAEYMVFVSEKQEQKGDEIYSQILEKKHRLESEITSAQRTVNRLRKELGTGSPEELVTNKRLRLDEAEANLASVDWELDTIQWRIRKIEGVQQPATGSDGAQATDSPASQPASMRNATDSEWRRLKADLTRAETTLQLKSGTLGDQHPFMQELRKRIDLTAGLLKAREQELDQHWVMSPGTFPGSANPGSGLGGSLTALKDQAEFFQYRRTTLVARVNEQKRALNDIFDRALMLDREIQDIQRRKELYLAVRRRVEEKEMERNVPGSIEILAYAFKPSLPHQDRRVVLTVMSVLGGLCVAFGLALIRANLSPSFHQADEIGQTIKAPFLGQIPLLHDIPAAELESAPILVEHMRMVRTVLTERLSGLKGNVVQITGATPGSGKTTIAILLAKSFAQCGKRVLLVDGDLRNPTVSRRLNVDIEPGLMGTLAQRATVDQAIVRSEFPGLDVMPAGIPTCEADAEMLGNGVFTNCLERWRKEYDIVLLDSPPALQAADARILSRQADGTIMVVREGYCRRADVTDALSYLLRSGATFLGTVFLGSRSKRAEYYGYGYGYSYGYDQKNTSKLLPTSVQAATEPTG